MFKKRQRPTKSINLNDELAEDEANEDKEGEEARPQQKVTLQSRKINRFSIKDIQHKQVEQPKSKFRPAEPEKPEVKYGLIERQPPAVRTDNDVLMDLYVQQKLKELQQTQQPKKDETLNTADEVMKLQRKFLEPTESKIASYDATELRRKFEQSSTELIRSEQEKRREYMKNLLENELERIEYASKKQLKEIRQERERDQKYLQANYQQEGRRYLVNSLKRQVLQEAIKK